MKFFCFILLLSLQLLNASSSKNIECDYDLNHYDVVGSIYQCKVTGTLIINTKEEASLDSATQGHYSIRDNDDVTGFAVNNKVIKYFPRDLDKIFKNLRLIHAQHNFIQEIQQSDLKPFPELKELNFHDNEIKMIEAGLFEFNPKLVYVSFSNNKIFYIHSDVFDGLSNLEYLYLNSNSCIDKEAYLSRREVLNVIEYVKNDCLGVVYKSMEEKLNKLEDSLTMLQPKDLEDKIVNFEAEFNSSSLNELSFFRDRLEKLKAIKPEEIRSSVPRLDTVVRSSGGKSFQIILILVILISIAIFGSIAFLFIKRERFW